MGGGGGWGREVTEKGKTWEIFTIREKVPELEDDHFNGRL